MRTLIGLLALAGCNHAPTWTAPPQPQVKQGLTLTIPVSAVDSDGDAVGVSIASTPDGIETEVDGTMISIHALYEISGAQKVVVRLDDHHGGISLVPVDVQVIPIGWQWTASFTDPAPSAREHGCFVVDADRDVAYLIGGSGYAPQGSPAPDANWTFDLAARTWSPLAPTGDLPPPGASRRAATLPNQKLAYLFGGYESNTTDSGELYRFDYSASPPLFKKLTQVNAPPARELHAFAYDPESDSFVTFGGYSNKNGILDDTWTMKLSGDTATWSKIAGAGPSPRYGFFYAMSPSLLYIWSGAQRATGSDPINAAQDTWAFDMSTLAWMQILDGSEAGAPPGRRNGVFVFDPEGPRLVIFGGTADGQTTVPGLSFLDLRPAHAAWATVMLDKQPPLRSSSFGLYDPKRLQSVLGFGNDRGTYRDLSGIGY